MTALTIGFLASMALNAWLVWLLVRAMTGRSLLRSPRMVVGPTPGPVTGHVGQAVERPLPDPTAEAPAVIDRLKQQYPHLTQAQLERAAKEIGQAATRLLGARL